MYTNISEAIHHELEEMDDKFGSGAPVTAGDLEMFDKMVHALKCLATYETMEEAYPRRSGRNERERGYYGGRRY